MISLNRWIVAGLVMLISIVPLLAACSDDTESALAEPAPDGSEQGGKTPAETVKITIGNITDTTGPAASALMFVNSALDDLVRYFNEEGLIPGVELDAIHYDGQYDPANDVPGYLRLRNQGADIMIAALPTTPNVLKLRVNQDEMVMFATSPSETSIDPPGWIFGMSVPSTAYAKTILTWVAENDWDYEANGPATVGLAGGATTYWENLAAGAEEYCNQHPDQFKWVGDYLSNQYTWNAEAESLREADYVFPPGAGLASFVKKYRQIGGEAKFICTDAQAIFISLTGEMAGWDSIDGSIFALPNRWWNEDAEIPNLARELIDRYRPGDYQKFRDSDSSYLGPIGQFYGPLLIVAETVDRVGAENFSSQALYDTATSFSMAYGESEEWSFTDTKRVAWNYVGFYEVSAVDENLVRLDTGWQPIIGLDE